jgi:DNA helicase HerA-like ATPase
VSDGPIILGQAGEQPLEIDLDRLVGSHLGIVANAGGGKSGLIRRLLEQTHGRIQHIVLDIEDEFYSLRERYDYVIADALGINRAGTTLGSYVSRLSTAGVIEKSGSSIRLSGEVMG